MTFDTFILVYRLPEKLTDGYCFGNGVPITFTNLDWFNGHPDMNRDDLIKFIRAKRYAAVRQRLLVITQNPWDSFIIEATA